VGLTQAVSIFKKRGARISAETGLLRATEAREHVVSRKNSALPLMESQVKGRGKKREKDAWTP